MVINGYRISPNRHFLLLTDPMTTEGSGPSLLKLVRLYCSCMSYLYLSSIKIVQLGFLKSTGFHYYSGLVRIGSQTN